MRIVRGTALTFAVAVSLSFTACNTDSEQVLNNAKIVNDEAYQKYIDLETRGELNSNGFYPIPEDQETVIPGNGEIYVTFADNRFLDMRYRMSDGTIVTQACYLKAGDVLYAEKPQMKIAASTTYRFEELRIRPCDDHVVNFKFEATENGEYKLEIPADFLGTELSILPLGSYADRVVKCSAEVIDENGRSSFAQGNWSLIESTPCRKETQGKETTLTFNPTISYTVRFSFDPSMYYVDEDSVDKGTFVVNGHIDFPSMQPSDETKEYTVKLNPLKHIEFKNSEYIEEVIVDNKDVELIGGTLKGLKSGSNVIISLRKGFHINQSAGYINESEKDGFKVYSITVPNQSKLNIVIEEDGTIDEKAPEYEGVEVSYYNMNGVEVNGANLNPESKYNLRITPKSGYRLINSKFWDEFHVKDGICDIKKVLGSECDKSVNEVIDKYCQKEFTIHLMSSDELGTFSEYKLDNEEISVNSINVIEGQTLKVTYTLTDEARKEWRIPGNPFKPNRYENSYKLKISSEMEDKELGRDDFEIELKQK